MVSKGFPNVVTSLYLINSIGSTILVLLLVILQIIFVKSYEDYPTSLL